MSSTYVLAGWRMSHKWLLGSRPFETKFLLIWLTEINYLQLPTFPAYNISARTAEETLFLIVLVQLLM
jgi:hypothetical protein